MRPMGGGGAGGPMGGMGGGPPPDKPEGPAEQAPSTSATDVATEPLPDYTNKKEKTLQFFQLNGYLRGRGFVWHNYTLGHYNDGVTRANPFTVPPSELPDAMGQRQATSCSTRNPGTGCTDRTLLTADMRFRLDPTLNLSEQVRIKAQIDIFDNLVLGSTPDGFNILAYGGARDGYTTFTGRGQLPAEIGVNALGSSIRAKRAWGEVKIPLVELSFGRMPFSWGSGMLFHDGNCADCDFGYTVDRVMVTARLWNHFLSVAYDWAGTGPTSQLVTNQPFFGFNYNIGNLDDINQVMLALGRKDDETTVQEKLTLNKPIFNYGLLALGRWQMWDLKANPGPISLTPPRNGTAGLLDPTGIQKLLGPRQAWSVTADVWAMLKYKKLTLEAEGAGIFGSLGELELYADGGGGQDTQLRRATVRLEQLGGVIRGNYKFLSKDALIVGLEVGSASGPQNGDPRGELNWRRAVDRPVGSLDPATGLISLRSSRFTFDPDYHVDMILFRRILGTVYNATYLKPSVTYWLIDNFGGQAEFIYSLANRPATMPGHAINMGAEINLRLMWKNIEEGFFAWLEYGVLFDIGALSQKQEIWNNLIAVDGTTAQAFQAKIMLKF